MVNVGGFFASLKLVSDKGSFDKGKSALGEIGKTAVSLGASLAKATLAVTAMAGAMAMVERKTLLNAKSAGLSVDSYSQWSASANIMGVSADALTSSIGALDSKFQQLKLGQVDEGLAKSLAFLGLGFGQVAGMKSEDRTKAVMGSALKMGDERKGAELVGQILGGAGKEFFYYLKMSGKSLNEVLEEAKKLTYTTYESKKNMMVFAHELSAVKGAFMSMGAYGLSKIAQQITPVITKMKEWLTVNKGLITSGIDKFANMIGNTFRTLAPVVAGAIELISGVFKSMPEEAQAMVKVGLLIKQGPLGQLMVLFMLIEDVVRFTQEKSSLFGLFLQEFGKAFGVLNLNESVKKGFDDLFKGALLIIQQISDIIGAFPKFLNQVSDAGMWFKSKMAGISDEEIAFTIEDIQNKRARASGGPILNQALSDINLKLKGMPGYFKYRQDDIFKLTDKPEAKENLAKVLKEILEPSHVSKDSSGKVISDSYAKEAWSWFEGKDKQGKTGYNVPDYPGFSVTDVQMSEQKMLIELTSKTGMDYMAASQVLNGNPSFGFNVKIQNVPVTK